MMRSREAGFSLVELLVAMVVTLIVSGAIYGLLASGQSAFRREPELTDRQQNIRVAMDLIKGDVVNAGAGMVPFVQAFTNGLDGTGGAATATQTLGSGGTATDVLEMLVADGRCPTLALSAPPAAATGPLVSNEQLPFCMPTNAGAPSFFYVGSSTQAATSNERAAYAVVLGRANLGAPGAPFSIVLANPATANRNPTAGGSAGFCDMMSGAGISPTCTTLQMIDVVRYQIAPDSGDAAVPALWRSRTGAFDDAGTAIPNPPGGNWEMVARGIDDLQILYFTSAAPAGWKSNPGNVTCTAPCTNPAQADLATIVSQVRITLSARALAPLLSGQQAAAVNQGGNAVRGQLTTVIAPRAALYQGLSQTPGLTSSWF